MASPTLDRRAQSRSTDGEVSGPAAHPVGTNTPPELVADIAEQWHPTMNEAVTPADVHNVDLLGARHDAARDGSVA